MALTIGDNFKYQANKPNFERDSFATLEAMKAYPETSIDDGHLSYCAETNKHYKFLSSNTVDETTGKWREFETTVGNSFPSDGIEGQYLKKSNTGVKWDDGDVFYLNSMDFDSSSVTQDTYNKLVNAITNNKIIYIVSNFGGENRAISTIESYYNENIGITIDALMDDVISTVHINPDLTVKKEVKESIPVATTNTNGLMSAEDKTKLDSVSNNANNYTHPAGSAASKSLGLYKISTDSTSHVKSVSAVTKSDITSLGIPAQDTTYNNATQSTAGLMSAADKEKLDSLNVDGGSTIVTDERALKGSTMRFNGFVNGVTITQTGVNEWDGIVYDTSINKFLAKKGTLTPTYHNVWSGMDAYMSDELGTSILKDKLYICDDVVYSWSDTENTLVKVDKEISNATQSKAGLMSAEDKAKLDNLDTSGEVSDPRALNGATMRFNGFVSGVTTAQVGASEWDSIVYDTSINKFLAKKGTLSPTYYNIWSGMDAYMTDGAGTDILKDRLYLYGEDIYAWSDTEGTLIKVTPDIPNASQSEAGLMSAEDKTKLDNVISRIVLSEFSEKKFFGEFSKVTGASAIGWAGALFIDDFSSSEYRDFYCCMTYGQGIVIRHTYKTGTYEYLNSFMVDSSTTSSSYSSTNKMNSGGWGKYYNNSELPLAYISRCSPDASYIHTYYAYKINRSVTPFAFERVLTIKYGGSKLAAITSDITIDAEKKYLYVHGYKSGSADAITGTSIVMVFNLPEPGSSDTITLNDSDILWEFEFFINEAAQDLCVSGGKLYYPYGSGALHGLAVIDTKTGKIIQNLDLSTLSTNFIDNPEPEGVALSNGNVYLNYHHSGTNSNEVYLVEFPLQEVKEALKVPTKVSQLENDAEYIPVKDNQSDVDLEIADEDGNVLAIFASGHVKTKNFNSAEISHDVKDLSNMTWCSLGTSITWYNNHQNGFEKGYQGWLMDKIILKSLINKGVNGGTLLGLAESLDNIVSADIYTIEHGVNDWGRKSVVGTIDDYINNTGASTFYGAYRIIIDAIYAKNSKAVIILCTPRKSRGFNGYLPSSCNGELDGIKLKDYTDAVMEVARYEGLPVCDWFNRCGVNDHNLALYSIDDALHPNDLGYKQMAQLLVEQFNNIY